MGIFSFLGNLASGVQGARMGKKQMQLGQGMMDEAQSLSSSFKRPELNTPAAFKMMVDMMEGRQSQNMPGMTAMQNQIDKAVAGGVSSMERMGTGAEAFGGVADLFKSQMEQQSGLGIKNAQYQDMAELDYGRALEGLGEYQQEAWQWNEADPYLNAQQKAAQLDMMGRSGQWEGLKTKMGSWAESFQGMGGALDDTMGGVASAMGGEKSPDLKKWMSALASTAATGGAV